MAWRSNQALAFLFDGPRCDGCIATYLGVPTNKANRAVHRWARRGVIVREPGHCPGCGAERLVSRALPEKFFAPRARD